MNVKSIKEIKNLKNKTVLVRCDFDVPIKEIRNKKLGIRYNIADDRRLRALIPTIKYLLNKKAKIILIGHLGRPCGKIDKKLSLLPAKKRLERLLKKLQIIFIDNLNNLNNDRYLINLKNGEIAMLENLRFWPEEEKNNEKFAKKLASLADIYVNEAFANSHRKHASMDVIQKYLPSYIGLHFVQELKELSKIKNKPKKIFVLIIGGAKVETKLPVIKRFIKQADYVLVGGVVANTFLKAQGFSVGKSVVDKKYLDQAKKILNFKFQISNQIANPSVSNREAILADRLNCPVHHRFTAQSSGNSVWQSDWLADFQTISKYKIQNHKLLLPIDFKKKNDMILDIGPRTIKIYSEIIKKAKTIIWNGPMGKFEDKKFRHGTLEIAKAILNSQANIVIGGGDTDEILKNKKLPKNIFVSSGGGAMLEFLAI